MFQNILDAIRSLFSNLFGGGSSNKPKPRPGKLDEEAPQDGSEIRPDSIIVVADEMEHIDIPPGEIDAGFDEDIFEEEGEPIVVAPGPVPEPEPAAEEQPAEPEPQGRYLWCLDNGHGRQTPGKRSPLFDDGETRFMEYEFNRDIVARIIKQLDREGISYFITVPEVDIDDFLKGRVDRANVKESKLPKIFVSIHSNAAPARSSEDWAPDSISGIETWFYHGSKSGQRLASVFQKHLVNETGWVNRHLKSRPNGQFYVLRKTRMPSVLTENGFYNNRIQVAELMKPEIRQKIADAHVKAILELEKEGI